VWSMSCIVLFVPNVIFIFVFLNNIVVNRGSALFPFDYCCYGTDCYLVLTIAVAFCCGNDGVNFTAFVWVV
jgi:hypothetical protein